MALRDDVSNYMIESDLVRNQISQFSRDLVLFFCVKVAILMVSSMRVSPHSNHQIAGFTRFGCEALLFWGRWFDFCCLNEIKL